VWNSSRETVDEFSGPIETWPTYKQISAADWETFGAHQVVFTDGSNAGGHEAGWLVCLLCEKKVSTRDMMYAHIESAKHKRNLDWFGHEARRDTAAPLAAFQLTAKDKQVLEDNRCVVEDDWIVCTLCNKKLMDMSFVPDHIATRKHRNNVDWANAVDGKFSPPPADSSDLPPGITVRENDFFCVKCNASMTSRTVVDVHVESQRHTRSRHSPDLAGLDVPIRRGIEISRLAASGATGPVVETARPLTPTDSEDSFEDRWRSSRVPSPPWTKPTVHDIPNLIDI
jgi:hypothetical protein